MIKVSTHEDIVSNVKVYGLDDSIKASKYPMAVNTDECDCTIVDRTRKLGQADRGSGHDNFLKGIIVQFDLTFTIKAWTEAERYHWFDIVSSQSTMHRITKFDPGKQCVDYVDPRVIAVLQEKIDIYNVNPTPENYLAVLYNVPVGFRLTARMTTNYQQLKTIHYQRKDHRLPEWKLFCKWIESLPHFVELCLKAPRPRMA